ncbi:MAG: hypothetical protein JXA69_04475 [Phycisphaerae bacterium]|nr:hypothetical protein [Phycisphaerae bacterium]
MSASQPARMTVRCSCQAKLSVPLSAAGRTVKCPKCGELLDVSPAHMELATSGSPAGGAAVASTGAAHTPLPPPAETAERVSVACPCGARLKVRPEAVGKKGKCPRCGDLIVLQVAADEPAEPESESDRGEGDADGPDSLFEQFGDMEGSARAPVAVIGSQPPCPSCGAAMLGGSSECPACGYDRSTGRRGSGVGLSLGAVGSVAGGLASGVAGVLGGVAGATGPFLLGMLLSAVGGLVGAAIWFVVVVGAGVESGWVAWGLGGLAGLGMRVGCRNQSRQAGVVAAGIAALSILAVKAALVVVVNVASTLAGNIELQRVVVAGEIAQEVLDERGITAESEREAQWEAAFAEAEQRVERMDDAEVSARFAEFLESEPEAGTFDDSEIADAEYGMDLDEDTGSASAEVFSWHDILFFLFGIATAYRVAAGGFTS